MKRKGLHDLLIRGAAALETHGDLNAAEFEHVIEDLRVAATEFETETKAEKALLALVDTINATGGLVEFEDGELAPAGDEEWCDLADAYLAACEALDVEPKIESYEKVGTGR